MFKCVGTQCPARGTNHEHLFNIDPRLPNYAIREKAYWRILTEEGECEKKGCLWEGSPHTHFQINYENLNMMTEKVPYIDPMNDERYDPEHISEYFTYTNIECKDYFTRHVHLYNIDLRVPFKAIEPEKYREMLA